MSSSQKIICLKCYKCIQKDFEVVCKICQCKFHKVCAKIVDEAAVNALVRFENIVYNCDNCLQTSSELVKRISLLSYEISELKSMFSQYIGCNTNNNNIRLPHRSLPTHSAVVDVLPNTISSSKHISSYNADAVVVDAVVADATGVVNKPISNSVFAGSSSQVVSDVFVDALHNVQNDDIGGVVAESAAAVDISAGATVTGENAVYGSEWSNVTKRRGKRNRRVVDIGDSDNAELDVVIKKKWVHLSSFKPTVTEDNIISYVSKHLDIDKGHITCFKLIRKGIAVDSLHFVNFKLGIDPGFYEELFKPNLWTADVKVRPFKVFPRRMPHQEFS